MIYKVLTLTLAPNSYLKKKYFIHLIFFSFSDILNEMILKKRGRYTLKFLNLIY